MDDRLLNRILKELSIIKKLVALHVLPQETQRKQIARLNSIGMAPKEIAEILGTTANTVNVALTNIRKSKPAPARRARATRGAKP